MGPKHDPKNIIIHFDYAVFEREDPKLKSLPLAVQQKQIVVTCNYEARRRGLYKLQLIREAKKKCPEVIIVLGEDLTRFRNASKDNYQLLRDYTWNRRVERLGFDEVFLDVTDMIDYNLELLNYHDLRTSFFHLDRNDPTVGFTFDASIISGYTYPLASPSCEPPASPNIAESSNDFCDLLLRLRLGSHLAQHLRHQLEEQKGYTSTVGIGTNKLISKLVGNVNKPKGQTTLLPPYTDTDDGTSNVTQFIDEHDIGKIPGIGFKTAQKIRNYVLGRPAAFSAGLVYGGSRENVKVKDVRTYNGMGPDLLNRMLADHGSPRDLGEKVWGLINGVDYTEVAKAKPVPQQISVEDSYIRLDEFTEVTRELKLLAGSLVKRMRFDLTSPTDEDDFSLPPETETNDSRAREVSEMAPRKWIALPKTLRLSTRPRPPLNPGGSRSRTFARISKSGSMPSFVLNLSPSVDLLADRLVEEALLPLFRKLHPEKSGWNLSLVNICATNMAMTANDGVGGTDRDIGSMFNRQEDTLKEWKVDDVDMPPSVYEGEERHSVVDMNRNEQDAADRSIADQNWLGSEDLHPLTQNSITDDDPWDSADNVDNSGHTCTTCGAAMPPYAMVAHERFHSLPD